MRTQAPARYTGARFSSASLLPEHPAPVRESISDRGSESPEDLAERFFEVFVDFDVLIVAEEAVREVGEVGDVGV